MATEREIVQSLPSLYPLTEEEEQAVVQITTRQPVEFVEEGCEDRAEMVPICPKCKEEVYNERWAFCPYCGTPIEFKW